MARLITTIGIRPELIQKYEDIRKDSGNFSEWVCNRIETAHSSDETPQLTIDALKKQIGALKQEIRTLFNHNGQVRKLVCYDDAKYKRIFDICMEDL